MKKVILIALFSISLVGYSQNNQTTYTTQGDLVKATYFHEDGSVSVEGYFKDKKLTGEWVRFDKKGNIIQRAHYKVGKKVGTWFVWDTAGLKEINYDDNAIVSVNLLKPKLNVAQNR
jgi:antitoxin component YwqK of YwqJK toxin-antitoxin module